MYLNSIFERDIDLLIIEEFKCNSKFAQLFTSKSGISSDYIKCTAHHSQYDRFGESDIILVLDYPYGKKIGILIEDKINAPSRESQSMRYNMRADGLLKDNNFNECYVFLVAPSRYIKEHKNDPNSNYDLTISYEEICDFFKNLGDKRSLYKMELFLKAIDKKEKKGYNADLQVSKFWNDLRDFCYNYHPDLEIIGKTKTHGTNSCWPEFRTSIAGSKVVYKSDRGYIDLQINNFGDRTIELRSKLSQYIQNDMKVIKTDNSASIRLSDENWIIDFHSELSDNLELIDEILKNVERMIDFSTKIKNVLPE